MEPDLDELRVRLRETQEAAERAAAGLRPEGWHNEGGRDATAEHVRTLVALAQALRDLVPEELRDQVRELLRQLVALLRAILDLVVQRLEGGPAAAAGATDGPHVTDIPIR
jgi:hypothetical protein